MRYFKYLCLMFLIEFLGYLYNEIFVTLRCSPIYDIFIPKIIPVYINVLVIFLLSYIVYYIMHYLYYTNINIKLVCLILENKIYKLPKNFFYFLTLSAFVSVIVSLIYIISLYYTLINVDLCI